MGSFLDKPKTEKTNDNGQGNNIRFGLSAMQGWRIEMEDSHSSIIGLPKAGFEEWSFFAVFDGHAGGTVSKFSSKELLTSILNADTELFDELKEIYSNNHQSPSKNSSTTQLNTENNVTNNETQSDSTNSPNKQTSNNSNEETDKTTTNSNKNDDSNNKNTNSIEDELSSVNLTNKTTPSKYTQSIENRLKNAIRKGFLDLDEKIRQMPEFHHGEDKSGSTAVACLISPSHIYLINCGDSRAILVSNNEVVLGTYDHKPINPNERERIQNAGGSVMIQRVNGSLAVSRALGDYEYKCVEGRGPCEQLVSPEPEIYIREREHDKDQFVVLACDGIWDVMSNDDLKEFINSRLKITNNLVQISNEILDMCLNKGSRDNMSLIIVSFPGAPNVEQEHVEKENDCNQRIENKIKELIESSNSKIDFSQVLSSMSQETWEDLPPGGGLHAKQALMEEIYNKLTAKFNETDRPSLPLPSTSQSHNSNNIAYQQYKLHQVLNLIKQRKQERMNKHD